MKVVSSRRDSAPQPNILLIVMDATRAQNLSCYGYGRPTTPNLERFAERHAVVYEQSIATSCWSLPCHASIFTGLYPAAHGADDQHQFLEPGIPNVAELLRARGYRTVALCQKRDISAHTGMDRGFDWFNPDRLPPRARQAARRIENGVARALGRRDAGLRANIRQMRRLLPQLKAAGQPFFLFLSTVESHIPYSPPRPYRRYLPDGAGRARVGAVNQDRWKYMIGRAAMSEEDFAILTALYDGGIAYADAGIAHILAMLERLGLLDDMLVIITGDHGENLGEHQLMAHGYCLYDTVVAVPLIIKYPRGVAGPGRVRHQVQSVDVLPTILALLGDRGSEVYRSLQGYDLLSPERHSFTIAEQANPDLSPFYRRFPGVDVTRYDRRLQMIRTDDYKYIWSSDGRHELYNLRADPGETLNLIAREGARAAELDRLLTERQGDPAIVQGAA